MSYRGKQEESLRDLVARVIDNGKAYVRAEVNVVRQSVFGRIDQWRPALIFVVVAILIVQAALTVAIAALGMLFARWIGPAGGLAAAALAALAIAGLLGWMAMARFKGSSR